MNSFAHYAFGAVCEWMFFRLAGIDSEGPGYKRILIQPALPPLVGKPGTKPISWVQAHYDSIRGRIATHWRRVNDRFELDVTIPANTTALVSLPATSRDVIRESGKPLERVTGVRFIRAADGCVLLAVESGTYRFLAQQKAGTP
jgi:alpha-L-rhamnosidase